MTPNQCKKIAAKAAKLIEDPDALAKLRERLGLTPQQWMKVAAYIPDFLSLDTRQQS